jgi:uncharacterized protein YbjT (DUF2867 family)
MMRTLLLTGATGLVSSALIQSLKKYPELKVRALVRDAKKASALEQQGIEVVLGDLDEPESLSAAFQGTTDLWLLNSLSPRQAENSMNALFAAKRAGVERVVRLSAVGAAHDAPTRNGRLHALSDAELMASKLKWTILRPHFFIQNLFQAAPSISSEGAIYWDMGSGKLAMIDVRDVADFAAQVLASASDEHVGKVYTLTGPESVSLHDVAAQLGEGIGSAVRYVPVPHEAARQAMLHSGLSPWLTGMFVEYSTAYSEGWGDFTTPHVHELLGRQARSVRDFARDHAAAFRAVTT